jgi:hypothetical protein
VQFKSDGFYEDGGKLFCRSCNCVVDHCRKGTIVDHQQSAIGLCETNFYIFDSISILLKQFDSIFDFGSISILL